jgi:hypothetical protein
MNVLMFEALEMECLRLRRHGAEAGGSDWTEQMVTGTGFIPPTLGRLLPRRPMVALMSRCRSAESAALRQESRGGDRDAAVRARRCRLPTCHRSRLSV